MASNYPLATLSEDIDGIDNTTDNVNPSTTKERGIAKAAHTRTLKNLTLSLQINDGRDVVHSLRTKLVSEFEKLYSLHRRVLRDVSDNVDGVAKQQEYLLTIQEAHREMLYAADQCLLPLLTPTRKAANSRPFSRHSSRSRSSASTTRQLQDAQLKLKQIELRARHDEEEAEV